MPAKSSFGHYRRGINGDFEDGASILGTLEKSICIRKGIIMARYKKKSQTEYCFYDDGEPNEPPTRENL